MCKFSIEKYKISEVKAIETERNGRCGYPQKIISSSFLQEAFKSGCNTSISQIATFLGVHQNSVTNYMKLYKIVRQLFSTISDPLLDSLIKQFEDSHPNAGIWYIHGSFLQQGIQIHHS